MCTQNLFQLSVRTIRGRPRWRRRSSWAPRRSRARLAWRPSRWPCSGWRRSRSASRPRPGARSPQPGTELRGTVRISAANYPSVFTITEKAFSLLLIENEEPPWLWKSMDLEQWKESLNSSEKTEYSPPSLSSLSLQFLVMVLSLSQPGPECFSLSVSSLVTSCSRAGGCEYNGGPGAHQSSSYSS